MNRILYILGLVLILGLSIFFMSKEDDISEFNNDKIIKHITINDYTKIEDMKSDRKSTSIQIEYIDEQKGGDGIILLSPEQISNDLTRILK